MVTCLRSICFVVCCYGKRNEVDALKGQFDCRHTVSSAEYSKAKLLANVHSAHPLCKVHCVGCSQRPLVLQCEDYSELGVACSEWCFTKEVTLLQLIIVVDHFNHLQWHCLHEVLQVLCFGIIEKEAQQLNQFRLRHRWWMRISRLEHVRRLQVSIGEVFSERIKPADLQVLKEYHSVWGMPCVDSTGAVQVLEQINDLVTVAEER